MKKKVVVTGMGVISPCGNELEGFWSNIKNGVSGLGPLTLFDSADFDSRVAGEVKDFDAKNYMDAKDARKMARFAQFACAASTMALKDSGLGAGSFDPERTGIFVGNGIGGYEVLHQSYLKFCSEGWKRMPPLTVPMLISNEAAGNMAMIHGIKGPALTAVTACASGTDGLGCALDMIRSGRVDVCLSGGTEGAITPFSMGGFLMLKTLSTAYNDCPQKASRPFDKNRDGFVIGEGAAILVLESEEHALKRGARIYAEFSGYGSSCDAYHLTSPDPTGSGGALAMRKAMEDSGIKPEDVDYFNAHGTSTPINDPTETKALKLAFGDHAYKMKVSSTKSMTGHCIGAAGAIEAAISILSIRDGFFPPTINLDEPDPECDLDYVPNKGYAGKIDCVMSSSLGFGGHNGVVAFKRYGK
jgi:3-oxoacyl-[acyl-carrier-protein] synthase II